MKTPHFCSSMSSNTIPQKAWLYKRPWNKKRDGMFLSFINNYLGCVEGHESHEIDAVLAAAMLELQSKEGMKLDFEDITCRFRMLKDRYEAFSLILRDEHMSWDIANGVIEGPDEAWNRLSKENVHVKAYYEAAEPHYALLSVVFGPQNPCEEEEKEEEVSEEVNSPVFSSKRRLFGPAENEPNPFPPHKNLPQPQLMKPPSASIPASSCSSSSPLMWWKH